MAGKQAEKPAQSAEVVVVPFAYATAKSGEVKQLVRGDVVDADLYDKKSLEHLRSIGFIDSK